MKFFAPLSLTLASCVAIISHGSDALACGGCFHGVDEANPSVVTGHRMALAISPTRTVLWDQVEYAGDPKEFAWVLPVGEGAFIEEADDAFFEALEAVSATRVMSRPIFCNGRDIQQQQFSGCGSSPPIDPIDPRTTDDGSEQQGAVRGVMVVHEGTVGPYETATIKSDDPQALRTWLTTNGYVIPPDIDPVIAAYTAEGASFIALRLQPGFGIRQMTPVRVITPGASPILPLRMVAAGTGASVSIVLYVIGEGRYRAAMRPQAFIEPEDLTWDWAAQSSDYATLRQSRMANGAFLSSFSHPRGFTDPVVTTDGSIAEYDVFSQTTNSVDTHDNLVDLYLGQAGANEGLALECGYVRGTLALAQPGAIVQPCAPRDPACKVKPNAIPSNALECEGHGDISAALTGMHPNDVWVTRLEANLPREALATDLVIAADDAQTPVKNWMIASYDVNLPACDQAAPASANNNGSQNACGGCATQSSRSVDPAALLIALMALLHGAKQIRRR
jgi:hypothetical protein